ncbi:MAG TPA: tail fiber domain-containing protein [Casimicrobiaceae bacterium]|jgi:hypothetical protein
MNACHARIATALAVVVLLAPAFGGAQPLPARDPVATVEANRAKIVQRIVDTHADVAQAHGVAPDAFRAALWALPPQRLLEASLADTPEEVTEIVAHADVHAPVVPKDGIGTGTNSWIGYTAGANVASGPGSAVAAGTSNVARGTNAFVAAGTFNAANGLGSFVGGGTSNVANGTSSLVMGGFDNQATVIDSAVVAGAGNRATGPRSVVVGGGYNVASGPWSFIGGGGRQTPAAGGAGTTDEDHVASGPFSTIAGGQGNRASGIASTIGGGLRNHAADFATVAGGADNDASAGLAAIAGGDSNHATNQFTAVGGGANNVASGFSSVIAGGQANVASGAYSIVAGGGGNIAAGYGSLAAGNDAHADQDHCALFGLWKPSLTYFNCIGVPNIMRVGADHGFSVEYHSQRADGGGTRWVGIGDVIAGSTIAAWNGAALTDAGVWVNASSSRERKTDFAPVDTHEVLSRVAALPITTWRYKDGEGDVRHMGPMAEDFWDAFGVGYGSHTIADLDARGVALAAIQALKQEVDARNESIDRLQKRLDALETLLRQMSRSAPRVAIEQ